MMPSSNAPHNPCHSPSNMPNATTTSSLAMSWPNVVALSSCISGGGSSSFPSPHSGRGHAQSASGVFAHCSLLAIHRAVNGPLLYSKVRVSCLEPWQAQQWVISLHRDDTNLSFVDQIMVFKISNRETCISALLCSHHQLARLEVPVRLYGRLSFLSWPSDIEIVVALQLISAWTSCMMLGIFHTIPSSMICTASGLYVPHRY